MNIILEDMEKIIEPIIPEWARWFIDKNVVPKMLKDNKMELKKWLIKNRNLINQL